VLREGMPYDPKRKRWSACGVCTACLANDCGDCINCMDKSKFGGQGVRKQSCIMRRCVRMTSNGSSTSLVSWGGGSSTGSCTSTIAAVEQQESRPKGDSEQALFWAAVSGMVGLTGQGGGGEGSTDDERTTVPTSSLHASLDDSAGASPSTFSPRTGSPVQSEEDARGGSAGWEPRLASDDYRVPYYRRGLELASPRSAPHFPRPYGCSTEGGTAAAVTGADSFCNRLANVLASDQRLASLPVAVRAFQKAGVVEQLANGSLSGANLASSITDPNIAPRLCVGLAAVAGIAAVAAAEHGGANLSAVASDCARVDRAGGAAGVLGGDAPPLRDVSAPPGAAAASFTGCGGAADGQTDGVVMGGGRLGAGGAAACRLESGYAGNTVPQLLSLVAQGELSREQHELLTRDSAAGGAGGDPHGAFQPRSGLYCSGVSRHLPAYHSEPRLQLPASSVMPRVVGPSSKAHA